jgi:hypothetical protein
MLSTLTELEQVERASVPNRLYVTTLSLSGAGVRERNHRYQHNIVPTVLGAQSKATANIRRRTRREVASCAIDDPCPGKATVPQEKITEATPTSRCPDRVAHWFGHPALQPERIRQGPVRRLSLCVIRRGFVNYRCRRAPASAQPPVTIASLVVPGSSTSSRVSPSGTLCLAYSDASPSPAVLVWARHVELRD